MRKQPSLSEEQVSSLLTVLTTANEKGPVFLRYIVTRTDPNDTRKTRVLLWASGFSSPLIDSWFASNGFARQRVDWFVTKAFIIETLIPICSLLDIHVEEWDSPF